MAKQVIKTQQVFKGKVLDVKLREAEVNPNVEKSEKENESATVFVSGLPEGVTENGVHIHFQKKKNGGGEVKEVKLLPGKKEATVVFEDTAGLSFCFYRINSVYIPQLTAISKKPAVIPRLQLSPFPLDKVLHTRTS